MNRELDDTTMNGLTDTQLQSLADLIEEMAKRWKIRTSIDDKAPDWLLSSITREAGELGMAIASGTVSTYQVRWRTAEIALMALVLRRQFPG